MKITSINPFNNQLIEEFKEYSEAKIDYLVKLSSEVFKQWKLVSFSERSSLMMKVAELLVKKKDLYGRTITLEMGKPISESIAEVEKCAWVCRYYAENAQNHLKTEIIKTEASESRVQYEPLGTILGIMPWNFPFWQVFRFLAPTLMAGNTALLKHSSNVQGCALQIESILYEAGIPHEVFKVLIVASGKINRIISNDTIKAVTLTGSEYAGSQVAAESGLNIKKSVLELGGSNAFIVLDDANIDKAVEVGIKARFLNAGQSCIAAKRFLVQKDISKEFISKFKYAINSLVVGDPMDKRTNIGPLSSIKQAMEVEKQVMDSIKMGAVAEINGHRENAFHYPVLLTNIKPGMPVMEEEVFGPVAPVIEFENDEDAISMSNKSGFGLGATIFTQNRERAEKMIPQLNEGSVFINELVKSDPRLPFGGIKKSGYGRELSLHGIREFVNAKTVFIK